MCDTDVGKGCDIHVQEQVIELLIRNHGGDVLWPQCHGGFKLLWVCLCVRSYRVFWNLYWSGCIQAAIVICQEIV